MRRVIPTVYQYTDYHLLLKNDFEKRVELNNHYSLRSYARDLKLSPGYLSSVLRGKKNFSKDNFKDIFGTLGFIDKCELKYIESLLDYKTSKNQLVKKEALDYLKKHYDTLSLNVKSERDLMLKSANHFIVYMLIEKIKIEKIICEVAKNFGVQHDQFDSIILDLVKNDYIAQHEGYLTVKDPNLAISNSDKILNCTTQLSKQLLSQIKKIGGIEFPENCTHTLTMGFDEDSFQLAVEAYKQFLHRIYRISQDSKNIDRVTIFSDIFMTTPVKTPENT